MLSASSKYALRALTFLVKDPGVFYSIETLSKETDVPGPYLSKIMKALAARDIVVTKKGLNGGIMLPKQNAKLSFYEICSALEDPAVRESCFLSKKKCGAEPCRMHEEWSKMKRTINDFLTRNRLS